MSVEVRGCSVCKKAVGRVYGCWNCKDLFCVEHRSLTQLCAKCEKIPDANLPNRQQKRKMQRRLRQLGVAYE